MKIHDNDFIPSLEADWGNDSVSNKKRSLVISSLNYRDGVSTSSSPHGSDRELDQKLTQIMVEIAMQNERISQVEATSTHDYLPVLTAGGLISQEHVVDILNEIDTFRSNPENKLFPPYADYGRASVYFYPGDYNREIVFYAKKLTSEGTTGLDSEENTNASRINPDFPHLKPESWNEIIERAPILNPGAAILPEYWERKPNIVDEAEGSESSSSCDSSTSSHTGSSESTS
jgi:hypothetical protein